MEIMQEQLFALPTTAMDGRSAERLSGTISAFPVGKKKPNTVRYWVF